MPVLREGRSLDSRISIFYTQHQVCSTDMSSLPDIFLQMRRTREVGMGTHRPHNLPGRSVDQ